jgi:SNF2 family DNA or RNA helicase
VPSSRERFERVRRFEAEPGFGALVLAPRAAGLGLTITAANHVIHYMREWNPAVEQQATDRAYRIGQTRPVSVHTLTATSAAGRNVEEVLHDLLSEKRRLMADFVVPLGGFDLSPEQILAAAGAAPPPNVEG